MNSCMQMLDELKNSTNCSLKVAYLPSHNYNYGKQVLATLYINLTFLAEFFIKCDSFDVDNSELNGDYWSISSSCVIALVDNVY